MKLLKRILRAILGVVLLFTLALALFLSWLVLTTPEPKPVAAWAVGPSMPAKQGELATATLHNPDRLVVMGGLGGLGQTRDWVYIYDVTHQHWEAGPPLPAPRHHAAAATLDGEIYFSGGAASLSMPMEYERNFWKLDLADYSWRILPDMPEARFGHRMVSQGGKLYVVGGQGPSSRVLIYDPEQGWSRGAAMPVQRDHLSVVAVGNEIWAIGGRAPKSMSRVDIYSIADDRWRRGPSLPKSTSGAAEGLMDGYIVIFGGEDPRLTGKVYDRHWLLDTTADNPDWYPAPRPPLAVHGADGAVLGGKMYIAGGASRNGILSLLSWSNSLQILDYPTPRRVPAAPAGEAEAADEAVDETLDEPWQEPDEDEEWDDEEERESFDIGELLQLYD